MYLQEGLTFHSGVPLSDTYGRLRKSNPGRFQPGYGIDTYTMLDKPESTPVNTYQGSYIHITAGIGRKHFLMGE